MKRKKPLFYLILIALFIVATIPYATDTVIEFSSQSKTIEDLRTDHLENLSLSTTIGITNILDSYINANTLIVNNINSTDKSPKAIFHILETEFNNNPNIMGLAIFNFNNGITVKCSKDPNLFDILNLKQYLKKYQQQLTIQNSKAGMLLPIISQLNNDNDYLLTIVSPSIFYQLFDSVKLDSNTSLIIVNRNGLIITSNQATEENSIINIPTIIDTVYSNVKGYFEYENSTTDKHIIAYSSPINLLNYSTNLSLIASQPRSEFESILKFIKLRSIIPIISIILIVIITANILYQYLINPINNILKMITYVHSGIFDHKLKLNRHGELGLLLKSFNEMVNNLEKRFQYQKRMRQEILLRNRYEEKLKSSRAEAVSLSKAKDEFLANISHEIRTPLNAIIGYSEKVLREHPNETFSKNIQTILSESDHLLLLLNDLLDNAKIEADKLDLEYIPFDLHKCLQETTESYREPAIKKNLSLSLEISDDTPKFVIFDPLRFKQVLVNLLSNAVKFTEKGSITVKTAVTNTESAHADVYFSVIDTGIGIPKDKQKSIFDEFSQADGSTTRKYGGTGLGTTISKKLVTLMGGEMCLKSELGKGSTFWFTLSLNTNISENDLVKITRENNSAMEDNANKFTGTILVAEDYEVNQDLIRSQLEYLGLNVLIANNGRIAVEDCKRIFFDLILMDLQMPEMGGIEAARRIRINYPHYEKIPIIALTANADKDIRNVCKAVGMNGILNKPTHIEELAASLLKWLPKSCHVSPLSISNKANDKSINNELTPEKNSYQASTDHLNHKADKIPQKEKPVDFEEAHKLFGNNKMIFNMALENFIKSAETSIIPEIDDAYSKQDFEALRRLAHKLKGGAASITAKDLSKVAGILENNSAQSNFENTSELIDKIKTEFNNIKEYVQELNKKS